MHPLLFAGYRPQRTRAVGRSAAAISVPADTIRTPPPGDFPLRLRHVLKIRDFLRVTPTSSNHRLAIVNVAKTAPRVQWALLRLLEEPPIGSCFIIVSDSLNGILDTIISRCAVELFKTPPYGNVVKDLSATMNVHLAARLAAQIVEGFAPDSVPDDAAFARATSLIEAARANDIELCLRLAIDFDWQTLSALRAELVKTIPIEVGALSQSFEYRNPRDAAVVMAHIIMRGTKSGS